MYILDTNVLSELMRMKPDPSVVKWIAERPLQQLYTTAVTAAEMRHGVVSLPKGKRRDQLQHGLDGLLLDDFANRILPFDDAAAAEYATWVYSRQSVGLPVSQFDAQIAAIAVNHKATLVTRNVKDFSGLNANIIDPWDQ